MFGKSKEERGYSAEITTASRELSKKEKVKYKDVSNMTSIGEVLNTLDELELKPITLCTVHVHNENAKGKDANKDYDLLVIEDHEHNLYKAGSESLYNALVDIWNELEGEEFTVKIFKRQSTNNSGQYITAMLAD